MTFEEEINKFILSKKQIKKHLKLYNKKYIIINLFYG